MSTTRQAVTAALLATAFGIAACSRSDEATTVPPKDPEPAQHKPVITPSESLAVKPTDGKPMDSEGFVASVPPKITGSFADGEEAYRARKYADATAIFERYTERRPANPWGHYMLGLSAWKSGDLAKSEQAFGKALSIDPHHVKSLVNLSRVFIDQKRHDEAVDRLTPRVGDRSRIGRGASIARPHLSHAAKDGRGRGRLSPGDRPGRTRRVVDEQPRTAVARNQTRRRGAASVDQRRGVAKERPGVPQQPRHGARAHRAFQGRGDGLRRGSRPSIRATKRRSRTWRASKRSRADLKKRSPSTMPRGSSRSSR